jgi:methylthioribose-1-phosphate isomerase
VQNPAFDVTPARYVTAIITERGIARAPYTGSLRALAG